MLSNYYGYGIQSQNYVIKSHIYDTNVVFSKP